jgi:hypothetical protein
MDHGQELVQAYGVGRRQRVVVPSIRVAASGYLALDVNEVLSGKGKPVEGTRTPGVETQILTKGAGLRHAAGFFRSRHVLIS